jgi:hypothetical protein
MIIRRMLKTALCVTLHALCVRVGCRGIKLVLPYVLLIVSPVSLSLSLTHSVSLSMMRVINEMDR